MPDTKISADAEATDFADADVFPLVQSGSNKRGSWATLKAKMLAGLAVFVGSGATAAKGLVPAPPTVAGTTKFLREDGTWSTPAGGGSGVQNNFAATVPPAPADDSSAGYTVGSSWMVPATGDMWRARSVTGGAARWVKIDVADHPGYVAGRFYAPFGQGAPIAGVVLSPTAMYLGFGVIKERITLSQLQARITTLAAGGNFQLAIYNHDPATAKGSTLVAATVSGSTAAAAQVNAAFTGGDVTLEPGPYWFALEVDNATAVFLAQGPSSLNQFSLIGSVTGIGGALNVQVAGSIINTGITFGTWPADISGMAQNEISNGRIPLIAFLVASVP